MRYQKRLFPLLMLVVGFAAGLTVSLLFSHGLNAADSRVRALEELPCPNLAGCVCDRDAEKLKRMARALLMHSQVTLNTSCVRETSPRLSAKNLSEYKQFLYPSNPNLYPGIPLGVPRLLRQEYMMKQTVLVGILTQQEFLSTRAQAVYETWGKEVSRVVFFVGEDCNISASLSHLPIIRLKGIPDHVYPPLLKAFAVLKYMYEHFLNDFNWFVRADDDMYVRGKPLMDLLKNMNPYERVYMGRAGVGKGGDLDRLHLLPHERYCMGGPGVIMSYTAMKGIGPHLEDCLGAVFLHDKHSAQKWNDDDVEIGRCISRKLDFQCSTSEQSRTVFLTDYAGDSLHPSSLWTSPHLHDIITIHPVKERHNMLAIHHFYKTIEYEKIDEELFDLNSELSQLCRNLPPHLSPPSFVLRGCQVTLTNRRTHHATGLSPSASFLVESNSTFFSNPSSRFELNPWKYFNENIFYDTSSLSPRHPFQPFFRAEVTHLRDLLEGDLSRREAFRNYQISQITQGYSRVSAASGREFILTLKLTNKRNSHIVKYRTVRLHRAFSSQVQVTEEIVQRRKVNVILPVSEVDPQLDRFVMNYVEQGVRKGVPLSLIIVVFNEQDAEKVETTLKALTHGLPKMMVTIAVSEGQFSLPKAVEVGMAVVQSEKELVFIANVDLRIASVFWERCVSNAHLGRQVYFPIPFWVYAMNQSHSLVNATRSLPHDVWLGEWVWLDPSLAVCLYKADFLSVSGTAGPADSNIEWFRRFINSHLQVFQAPDPALYSFWSRKSCNDLNGNSRRQACLSMQRNSAHFPRAELTDYLADMAKEKAKGFWFRGYRGR